jgi:hypothetical protein
VEAARGHAPACKAVDEITHKRDWTADVEVRIGWDAHFLEHLHTYAPHAVEIDSRPVSWLWCAATNVTAASGQGVEEITHVRRKWMLAAVTGSMNPPNLSPRLLGGQLLQHSEDWGGTDAGADKDHGTLALLQRKAATGGAHIENIACLNRLSM